MQKIVPNLWFDHNAEEATQFYTSVFPGGRILDQQRYPEAGLPDFQAEFAGQVVTVDFELAGYRFIAINAGPEFPLNPSISFMLRFDAGSDPEAKQHLDELWAALMVGGQALMPLQSYDFSPHYGWVADRYGVNWQLLLTTPGDEPRPFITPSLMFGHDVFGRAREAIEYYTAVFGGRTGTVADYPAEAGASAGKVMYADFELFGQWFTAMDGDGQEFGFNCGVSLLVECDGQAELDRYWNLVSAVPEAEQCGWCADKFGVSWQFVPANLGELMAKPGAYPKLLAMKKIEIAAFG